jgi:hypothetical protein
MYPISSDGGFLMATLLSCIHLFYVLFILTTPLILFLLAMLKLNTAVMHWMSRLHMAALIFVVLQYAFDWACPLTVWENQLRGLPPSRAYLNVPAWLAEGAHLTAVGLGIVIAFLGLCLFAHYTVRKHYVAT